MLSALKNESSSCHFQRLMSFWECWDERSVEDER